MIVNFQSTIELACAGFPLEGAAETQILAAWSKQYHLRTIQQEKDLPGYVERVDGVFVAHTHEWYPDQLIRV